MKFGPYEIAVTARANCRSMRLHFHPADHRLTLSVPKRATKRMIEDFLTANRGWIDARMQGAGDWRPSYAAGERHLLLGRYVTLGQDGVPVGEAALRRYRAKALSEVLRHMLPQWESRMSVHVTRLTIRDMTSRWGSCRADRATLSMNLRLALVPEECVEQVLVHELCHLFHPNHSPAFYAKMTRFLPGWPELKKRLDAFDLRPLPPL
ncbi:MAG: M48 family metallopeptidase [Christensenellaceae bacterium]|nr:M48 family metallopeptidase [Christensenellaceae bacterium]